jgi:hypothetical protein
MITAFCEMKFSYFILNCFLVACSNYKYLKLYCSIVEDVLYYRPVFSQSRLALRDFVVEQK